MRTKRIKLYKFTELSTEVQDKIINKYWFESVKIKQDHIGYLKTSETEYLQDGTIYTEQ